MQPKMFLIFLIPFLLTDVHQSYSQIEQNEIDWGVHSQDFSNVGTTGWQFLKLPTNARNAALGGVKSSLGHGSANSALTNPASMTDVDNWDFSFNFMEWVADIGVHTLSAVKNFGKLGAFGFSAVYMDYGNEIRTEYQETLTISDVIYAPALDGLGTVGASDLAVGLSYAKRITHKLQVGGSLRYLEEHIDDAKTNTWSLDIGTVYYTGFRSLRISMLGRNFGPDAEFGNFGNRIQTTPFRMKMPMQLSIGAAIDILEKNSESPHHMILAVEYNNPNDGSKKLNFGSEYTLMDMFSVRAGYRFNYDEQGLTLGGGVNYGMTGMVLKIDYAYLDVGLFNNVHMFSIGIKL